MISHDVDKALLYASHILHIGHEIFFGSRQDYMESKIREKKEETSHD